MATTLTTVTYTAASTHVAHALKACANDDALTELLALGELTDVVDELRRLAVYAARADGASWAAIGGRLGMTKQAAQQRYGTKAPAAPLPGQDTLPL